MLHKLLKHFRPRNYILIGGSILVMSFMLFSDPNGGSLTSVMAASLATPVIAVFFAHLARYALFDYADMMELYDRARQSAVGAAIIFASMCIVIFALLGLFGNQVKAQNVDTYIPKQANTFIPVLRSEQETYWSAHPAPFTLLGK